MLEGQCSEIDLNQSGSKAGVVTTSSHIVQWRRQKVAFVPPHLTGRDKSGPYSMEVFSLPDIFHEIDNCVTAPQGFRAGVTACGIKSDASIKDLAILVSDVP